MGRTPRSSKPRARRASDPPPAARAGTRDRPSEATPAVLRGATADRWFGDLLESAPDAIVGVDDQGRIVLINSQTEKIFGYGRDELLNQPVEILLPERVRRAHERHRAGYVVDPRTRPMGVGLDLAGRRKDGSEFPAEISLSPFQTRDGVIVTSIIRDISDRKKVEGKFRGLLEAAPDAMIMVERTGRIVLVNSQAERLFGYRRDQLLGQPVEMLVPERFRGHYLEHRVAYFEGPRVRAMGSGLELYGLRRDGSEFPVEISLSPLETEEGILVTSAIRDGRERRGREAGARERPAVRGGAGGARERRGGQPCEGRVPLRPLARAPHSAHAHPRVDAAAAPREGRAGWRPAGARSHRAQRQVTGAPGRGPPRRLTNRLREAPRRPAARRAAGRDPGGRGLRPPRGRRQAARARAADGSGRRPGARRSAPPAAGGLEPAQQRRQVHTRGGPDRARTGERGLSRRADGHG